MSQKISASHVYTRRDFRPEHEASASALCAKCVRPSFILVIRASGSEGEVQSLLAPFFFRLRSSRAKSARVGVSMPDACANAIRNS